MSVRNVKYAFNARWPLVACLSTSSQWTTLNRIGLRDCVSSTIINHAHCQPRDVSMSKDRSNLSQYCDKVHSAINSYRLNCSLPSLANVSLTDSFKPFINDNPLLGFGNWPFNLALRFIFYFKKKCLLVYFLEDWFLVVPEHFVYVPKFIQCGIFWDNDFSNLIFTK